MKNLPSFFDQSNDDEFNPDHGKEGLVDFFLAWTIQCAHRDFEETEPKLNHYAKQILYYLLYEKEMEEDVEFVDIQAYRQWKNIDLIFEVSMKRLGVVSKIALVIEDKFYTTLHDDQLSKYSEIVKNHYEGKDFILRFVFLTLDYVRKHMDFERNECERNNFTFLSIEELKQYSTMDTAKETGNHLFDEFWFKFIS
jgi:hypothetical protein